MKERVVYLDYLRFFAILAVVFVHVSGYYWYQTPITTAWHAMNIYDSLFRWAVPVFVMISGALLIPREITIKDLLIKKVLKLLICFLVWSIIYAFANPGLKALIRDTEFDSSNILNNILNGNYHMWFIPMIMGLYLCLPFFQKIAQSQKTIQYFLVLSFLFAFLIPQAINLLNDFAGEAVKPYLTPIQKFLENTHLDSLTGYAFFFSLGHYLNTYRLSKNKRLVFILMGLIGFAFTIVMTAYLSLKNGQNETYYDYITINVMLEAICVFLVFQSGSYKNEELNKIFENASKLCFGVYLVHPLAIWAFILWGLTPLSFNPWLAIPTISFLVLLESFAFSLILNKIPIINKVV